MSVEIDVIFNRGLLGAKLNSVKGILLKNFLQYSRLVCWEKYFWSFPIAMQTHSFVGLEESLSYAKRNFIATITSKAVMLSIVNSNKRKPSKNERFFLLVKWSWFVNKLYWALKVYNGKLICQFIVSEDVYQNDRFNVQVRNIDCLMSCLNVKFCENKKTSRQTQTFSVEISQTRVHWRCSKFSNVLQCRKFHF